MRRQLHTDIGRRHISVGIDQVGLVGLRPNTAVIVPRKARSCSGESWNRPDRDGGIATEKNQKYPTVWRELVGIDQAGLVELRRPIDCEHHFLNLYGWVGIDRGRAVGLRPEDVDGRERPGTFLSLESTRFGRWDCDGTSCSMPRMSRMLVEFTSLGWWDCDNSNPPPTSIPWVVKLTDRSSVPTRIACEPPLDQFRTVGL